ncbi:glycosyltransferase family 2 protein [Paenibacillus senegalimassiliensis]|uniref:glycosyltransferase family 2 protein n=1 Tax=Paenibacillus senegalimassiliensis TaxID=1737426 RepID=UPI000B0F3CA8|nr:glycosyltransferase [Paenibacillus senegalimassiliensis]
MSRGASASRSKLLARRKMIRSTAESQRATRLALRAGEAGALAGRAARENRGSEELSFQMQEGFREWYARYAPAGLPIKILLPAALAYHRGYAKACGAEDLWIPLPLQGTVTAIVTASNEEKTLPAVLAELRKLPLREIIIVLNGCEDGSFAAVDQDPRITRLSFPQRLGHDVGRAVGASVASGDILLFTDGDICVPAEELAAFILAVDRGEDLVLNDLTPYLPAFAGQDEVTRCKVFLNHALGRPDLRANSLTAVPHAMSRRAVQAVGTAALLVPPKAQAMVLARGLAASAPVSVDVIRSNRVRSGNSGAGNAVAQMIIGDHVEALGEVMKTEGVRLSFATLPRNELAKVRNAK